MLLIFLGSHQFVGFLFPLLPSLLSSSSPSFVSCIYTTLAIKLVYSNVCPSFLLLLVFRVVFVVDIICKKRTILCNYTSWVWTESHIRWLLVSPDKGDDILQLGCSLILLTLRLKGNKDSKCSANLFRNSMWTIVHLMKFRHRFFGWQGSPAVQGIELRYYMHVLHVWLHTELPTLHNLMFRISIFWYHSIS